MIAFVALVGTVLHSVLEQMWLARVHWGLVIEALIASSLLAGRSLYQHVSAVAKQLATSLPSGRRVVSHIVGRDTRDLDATGVSQAAIESLAENSVDGLIAPLFWCMVAGLPGLMVYKVVNTLDSMWGHHNDTYEWFGKPVARLDDVMNWLPARLMALLTALVSGHRFVPTLKNLHQHARKHRSVNAGWPESAFALSLQIFLGGTRYYVGEGVVKAQPMGEGTKQLGPEDIDRALGLYIRLVIACAVFMALIYGVMWVIS